jgi:hypothetical protein
VVGVGRGEARIVCCLCILILPISTSAVERTARIVQCTALFFPGGPRFGLVPLSSLFSTHSQCWGHGSVYSMSGFAN